MSIKLICNLAIILSLVGIPLIPSMAAAETPEIESIDPVNGHITGGLTITIRLSGWLNINATKVYFGDEAGIVTGPTRVTPGTPPYLTVSTPASAAGTVDVRVEESGVSDTLSQAFTFHDRPVITELSPSAGSTAGGNIVRILGYAFTLREFDQMQVLLNNVPVTEKGVGSDGNRHYIWFRTPPNATGDVAITVVNSDGSQAEAVYRFEGLEVLEVDPPTGSSLNPGVVNILGQGMSAFGVEVLFDGEPAYVYETESTSQRLQVRYPVGRVGAADVTVRNPDGATFILPDAFQYEATAPLLLSIRPETGSELGGNEVTLLTRYLGPLSEAQVLFGGVLATSLDSVSCAGEFCPDGRLIICRVPAHEAGPVDVTIINRDSLSSTLEAAYTYLPATGDEGELPEGEAQGSLVPEFQMADTNTNGEIELNEILRVIQFHNALSFHCEADTEDGFAPGLGDTDSCDQHTSDYDPADWLLSLNEILRAIQFHNSNGYERCDSGEDGYCPL